MERLVCYEPEALIGDTDWEVVLCLLVPLWPYELYCVLGTPTALGRSVGMTLNLVGSGWELERRGYWYHMIA